MSVFARPQPAEPTPDPGRCVACRRHGVLAPPGHRVFVGVALEIRSVPDAGLVALCVDPVSCRCHWPKETT